MSRQVRVKICGVTRPEDADAAVVLGADYLGLNFHPPSPRFVSRAVAREIAGAVAGRVPLVGVFVNLLAAEVEDIAAEVGLDLFQFSGDEEPADLRRFASKAIKALRTGGETGSTATAAELAPYADFWALLFDARHDALYGGTGIEWPYAEVAAIAAARRVFVAGGLRPGNARRAADLSGAFGIDVCSGVESAPGIKDPGLLARLFEEVRDGQADPAS